MGCLWTVTGAARSRVSSGSQQALLPLHALHTSGWVYTKAGAHLPLAARIWMGPRGHSLIRNGRHHQHARRLQGCQARLQRLLGHQ